MDLSGLQSAHRQIFEYFRYIYSPLCFQVMIYLLIIVCIIFWATRVLIFVQCVCVVVDMYLYMCVCVC